MKNRFTVPLRMASLSLLLWGSSFLSARNTLCQSIRPDTLPKLVAQSNEFLLEGVARNGDTGENFDHIYVDVYKLLPEGGVEIVRADRFLGGTFKVWLRRDERYMLMMNYNNIAFLEGILDPESVDIVDGVLSQIFILDEYYPELKTAKTEVEAEDDIEVINALIELKEKDQTPLPNTPLAFANTKKTGESPAENPAVSILTEPVTVATKGEMATKEFPAAIATQPGEPQAETPSISTPPDLAAVAMKRETATEETPAATSLAAGPAQEKSLGTLFLNGSTSLRSQATHLSESILRFSAGQAVELLEKTDQYWWKVRAKGKTGWVKAAMLQNGML